LILILGDGTLKVNSGKPTIEGAVVLAKFNSTGGFIGPTINLSGTPEVIFKHGEPRVDAAMKTINILVKGVRDR
jgi:hypothetical protein